MLGVITGINLMAIIRRSLGSRVGNASTQLMHSNYLIEHPRFIWRSTAHSKC